MLPFVDGSAMLAGKVSEIRTSDRFRQDIEKSDNTAEIKERRMNQIDSAERQQEHDELEAKHDFWSFSESFIVVIMFKRYKNCMCHRKGHLSGAHTTLD